MDESEGEQGWPGWDSLDSRRGSRLSTPPSRPSCLPLLPPSGRALHPIKACSEPEPSLLGKGKQPGPVPASGQGETLPHRASLCPLKACAALQAGLPHGPAKQATLAASENMVGLCQAFRQGQGGKSGLRGRCVACDCQAAATLNQTVGGPQVPCLLPTVPCPCPLP